MMLRNALLVSVLVGCGASTHRVIEASIDAAYDDRSQIGALVGSPELQAAARELSQALIEGGVDGLKGPELEALIHARSASLVEALSPVLADAVRQDLGPAVREELRKAVAEAAMQATSAPVQHRVERMVVGITGAVAEVLIPQVGPAVGAGLRDDILPAIEGSLRKAIVEEDQNLVRNASKQAMLGIADALDGELGRQLDLRAERLQQQISSAVDQQTGPWQSVATGLLFGLLGVIGASAYAVQTRRKRTALLENTLLMVMGAIKSTEAEPGVRQAVRQIKANGRDSEQGLVLKELLRQKPDLRVDVDALEAST